MILNEAKGVFGNSDKLYNLAWVQHKNAIALYVNKKFYGFVKDINDTNPYMYEVK